MTTLTSSGGETFPGAVVATAGSYTVPAGAYAILRAAVSAGRSLAINGVTVMAADNLSWSTQRVNSSPYSGLAPNSKRTLIADSPFNTQSSLTSAYANSTAYNRNSSTQTYKLPPGTVISGNAYKLIEVY